jgi:hypothetical protein
MLMYSTKMAAIQSIYFDLVTGTRDRDPFLQAVLIRLPDSVGVKVDVKVKVENWQVGCFWYPNDLGTQPKVEKMTYHKFDDACDKVFFAIRNSYLNGKAISITEIGDEMIHHRFSSSNIYAELSIYITDLKRAA